MSDLNLGVTATDPAGLSSSDDFLLAVTQAVSRNDIVGTGYNDIVVGGVLADFILGLAGNERLSGGEGDDLLDGGAGDDRLTGGGGADTYRFGRGSGQDEIVEFLGKPGEADRVLFDAGIRPDQLWLSQADNDLEVSVIGSTDSVLLRNWYAGDIYRVEQFVTADGSVLLDTQVQQLVDAMAAFSPPPAGELALNADQHLALDPVFASSWQSPAQA